MFKRIFLKNLAKQEKIPFAFIEKQIRAGRIIIPLNNKRKIPKPVAIGEGCKIKINANIGTSTEKVNVKDEIKKIKTAVAAGAHTIMDLSVGGNLGKVRKQILKH